MGLKLMALILHLPCNPDEADTSMIKPSDGAEQVTFSGESVS